MWPIFLELSQDIGHKLRVHQKSACGIAIHIRDNTLFSKQWQMKLDFPTQSPLVIAKNAFNLFKSRYQWNNPIRSVTIQAIDLIFQDAPFQLNLFYDAERNKKREKLDECVELLRMRFGKDIIKNAILFKDIPIPGNKAELLMPSGMII